MIWPFCEISQEPLSSVSFMLSTSVKSTAPFTSFFASVYKSKRSASIGTVAKDQTYLIIFHVVRTDDEVTLLHALEEPRALFAHVPFF